MMRGWGKSSKIGLWQKVNLVNRKTKEWVVFKEFGVTPKP
jgi:hypothetical protein